MEQQIQRQLRMSVDIPIIITTVLDSIEASIVDLTEHGAQVTGSTLAEGSRFQIDYMGQTIFASCRWSEVDRMGIRFSFPLTGGPLYERLTVARSAQVQGEDSTGTNMAISPMQARMTQHGFVRAQVSGGFGRRTA